MAVDWSLCAVHRPERTARHTTLRHEVRSIFAFRDFAAAGGLMSYGGSFIDTYRHAASIPAEYSKGE